MRHLLLVSILALAVPITTGCATVKPIASSTAACSADKVLPSVTTAVEQALSAPAGTDVQAQLTQLAISAGLDVVQCAVAAIVAQLEAGKVSTPPPAAAAAVPTIPPSVQLLRAYAFQAAHSG